MTPVERAAAFAQFTTLLRRMKANRGVTWRAIADAADIDRNSIASIRDHRCLPKLSTVRHIADFLLCPSLYEMAAEMRTVECERCDLSFLVPNGSLAGKRRRRFCSAYCSGRARYLKVKDQGHREALNALEVMEGENVRLRRAIDKMCRECAGWDGLCRITECRLRDVTPLPIAEVRVA